MAVHKDEVGTVVRLDAGVDITGASEVHIRYEKPNGMRGSWTAAASTTYGQYTTQSGDLDIVGVWKLQLYIVNLSGWTGFGEESTVEIVDHL